MRCYWISSSHGTYQVDTDDAGKIVCAAPIVGKFHGQPYRNLIDWLRSKFGDVSVIQLFEKETPDE